MAYVVSVTETAQNSGSTLTVSLGAHQTNDLLLCCVSSDTGGTTISTSTSGWTNIGTFNASGSSAQRWAYKVAASGAEPNPAFAVANATSIGTCLVIRDADATNPLGATPTSGTDFVRSDYTGVSSTNSGSLTTAADGCLLLYSWNSDAADIYMRCLSNDLIALSKVQQNSAQQHIIGYRQQNTAGSAPTVTMYRTTSTNGGNGWILAVRNKSGGIREKDCRTGMDEFAWYGSFNAFAPNPTWAAVNAIIGATLASINSITCSSTSPTVANTATQALTPWGKLTSLTSTESTAGSWVGGTHAITSKDMSGKVFALQWQIDGSSETTRIGSDGAIVLFSDGTDWVAYQLMPKTAMAANTPYSSQIALGSATVYAASDGTGAAIDWTAITNIGYCWHRILSTLVSSALWIKNACLLGGATGTAVGDGFSVLTGGGTTRPVTFTTLIDALGSWGSYKLAELQGSAQVLGKSSVYIGDGTAVTVFDAAASSFEFPVARSFTTQPHWNALTSSMGVTVKASASDNIALAAGVMATTVQQALTIDASSSTSATFSVAGESFVGWSPTWKTGVTCASTTFKSCGIIDFKGADLVSVIANSGTGTALISASDGFSATGCTFTASSTAVYGIRIAAAGTFSLDETTFSGFTKDIDVTAATGTVTINLAAGQSTPTYQTAGATVDIVSSPVFQSVAISGATAGTRIQVYDTTSSTELYNGTPSFPYTWTDASPAASSRAIRLRVAYVSGTSAKQFIEASIGTCGVTSGTESVSYLVNQTDDTVYNSNAENGATIYGGGEITFVDSSPDRVEMAISTNTLSLPKMYAAWVYYAFTSAGIAVDIDYINAIDPANYEYTNIKWKNTSSPSVKLKITGGYAWDSSTLDPMDLVDDTGGTLFLAPAHVVSYATGSGVTPGDVADIASASATAAATAVWDDSKALTVPKFLGLK